VLSLRIVSHAQGDDPMFALHDEKDQGLVEYGLILIFVALFIILIVGIYGANVANYYSRATSSIP